jgi:hypothetical protein
VTAIWSEGTDGWELLKPAGFPDERTLQELVAKAPDLLPLAGSPRVVVLGREVLLGSGYVDVLAIEAGGRPVVIEVKLRNNTESRRAVVSQILAYAAGLHGTTAEEFERRTVARQLAGRGLLDFVRESAQAEVAEADDFQATLHSSLQEGSFRLVLVLDAAPQELVKLVGYLEAVTQGLVIDLITVASYEIAGRQVVVPRRVEPERPPRIEASGPSESSGTSGSRQGELVAGAEGFRTRVAAASGEQRATLDKLVALADRVAVLGSGVEVSTYYGKRAEVVLLPRLLPDRVGLASLYCYADGKPAVQMWRSVFERKAPRSMGAVALAAGVAQIGQGAMAAAITDELMEALYGAYREALLQ